MKNEINKGLSFQKEAITELNTESLKSINSGQDTLYRTDWLVALTNFITNGGVTQD